jgi:hypothetical protein
MALGDSGDLENQNFLPTLRDSTHPDISGQQLFIIF